MDKIAPSFSFHIDAGQQSSHGVSAPLLIQVIENAQNAVELIGCDVEGKEFKQRVKIPTRISRKYQLICQVPVTGSYAMPMTLGDPGSDLFVKEWLQMPVPTGHWIFKGQQATGLPGSLKKPTISSSPRSFQLSGVRPRERLPAN